MGLSEGMGYGQHVTRPTIIDERTVEFSSDEQYIIFADHLKQLFCFEFLVRTATAEGKVNPQVRQLSIAALDPDQHPDEPYIASIRACLRYTSGVPVQELLDEIHQRRPEAPREQKRAPKKETKSNEKPLAPNGTMNGASAHDGTHPSPAPRTAPSVWEDA